MNPAVKVVELGRVYKTRTGLLGRSSRSVEALRGISLKVNPGEVFGLVGPNGAGKTTLIRILTTLLLPSSGAAYVLGLDVSRQERQIRRHINFVLGGEQGLYWRLSGEDNLCFLSDLHRVPQHIAKQRIPELLKLVGLWDRRKDRVEHYSKGMKQRLHIARALVNDAQVLFLDEPTIGLDPAAARHLREIIGELHARGITIFITSHYMGEMEILCDRIAVLNRGKIIALDTPKKLKRVISDMSVVELQTLADVNGVADKLRTFPSVSTVTIASVGQASTLRVFTDDAPAVIKTIRAELKDTDLSRLVERPPDLEDAYIELIGSDK